MVNNHLGIMTKHIWSNADGHVLHMPIYLQLNVCLYKEAGVRITCAYQHALNVRADSPYISLTVFAVTLQ